MPSLNDVQVKVSTTSDNSGINEATTGLGNMVDSFQSGMRKISAVTAVAGAALTAFSKGSVDYLKDVVVNSKALARETGLTTIQSSQLLAVMEKLGISASQTSTAFKTFSKNIADSRDTSAQNSAKIADMNNKIQAAQLEIKAYTEQINKNGDASGLLHNKIDALNIAIEGYKKNLDSSINTLDKLGVVTIDATGHNKDFNTILLEVADKFHDMPDGVEKTADALSLFGKSGLQMIKILDKGSQGIQDLESEATKLGLTLTAQNIGAISDYIASQKKLAESTNSIKIQVGSLTAPLMTNFNNALDTAVNHLVGMDSPFRTVTADALAFGGPILGASSGVAAFVGNLGSANISLGSIGKFLLNPMFLIFAASVAVAGYELNNAQKKAGGWSNLLAEMHHNLAAVIGKVRELWAAFTESTPVIIIIQYFQQVMLPALKAIWAAIVQNLLPAIEAWWHTLTRLYAAMEPGLTTILKVLAVVIGGVLLAAIWAILAAINVFIQILSFLQSTLSLTIGWISNLIGWFGNLVGVVWNAVSSIINIFRNLWPAFRDVVGVIGAIIGGVGNLILAPFRWAYDSIIGLFRGLPGALGSIISGAFGSIGGAARNTLHSLHIPGFAVGGYTGYGSSDEVAGVVHKGEYVLPQSAVNQRTGQPKGMGGNSTTIHNLTVVLPNVTDKASLIAALDQDTLLMSKGLTPNRGSY